MYEMAYCGIRHIWMGGVRSVCILYPVVYPVFVHAAYYKGQTPNVMRSIIKDETPYKHS